MKLTIQEGSWIGFVQLPNCEPIPTFVHRLIPLKTGKGILRLELSVLRYSAQQHPLTIDIQVLVHDCDFLVGRRVDEAGKGQTLMIKACKPCTTDLLTVAQPTDFHELRAMPDATEEIHIGKEYGAFDSYLIQRGFAPQQMEDKWLIYMTGNKLQFHRSWTGHCIYSLSVTPREGRLYLDNCTINGNRDQYKSESTLNERDHVLTLIDYLLIRPFEQHRI
ncbi:hypothetical protein [Pseudoduganella sp. OTU4001]|uniref:hypothetical protein n=1 Tax=Pseudoduganella sp. OTU4001 TaxID=3043854 RepID=UPI00313EAEBD